MEDKYWNEFVDELIKRGYADETIKQIAFCAYNIGKVVGEYDEKLRVTMEVYK